MMAAMRSFVSGCVMMELCRTRYVSILSLVYLGQFHRDSVDSELTTAFGRPFHCPANTIESVRVEEFVRPLLLPEDLLRVRDTVLGKSGMRDDGTERIQLGFWVGKQRGETAEAGSHLPDETQLGVHEG